MAPEQCLRRPVDARTDVFALGICLWEALAGRTLFKRKTEFETIDALLHDAAPSLCEIDPDVPPALDAIARRALAKRPSDRFGSAGEMGAALEEHLAAGGHVVNTARIESLMRSLFAPDIRDGPCLEPIEGPTDAPDADEESGLGAEPLPDRPTARPPPRAPQLPDEDQDWTPLTRRRTGRARRTGRRIVLFIAVVLLALFALAEGDLFGAVPQPQPEPRPQRAQAD
jgi:serine/threonine-protein kinase